MIELLCRYDKKHTVIPAKRSFGWD